MGRGLIVAFAWPIGILAAIVCVVALAPTCSAGMCALEPVPAWKSLLEFAVAFGPGLTATAWWWRGRREP